MDMREGQGLSGVSKPPLVRGYSGKVAGWGQYAGGLAGLGGSLVAEAETCLGGEGGPGWEEVGTVFQEGTEVGFQK